MKSHRQIAAALNIAAGVLYLIAALAVFAFMGLAGGVVMSQGEHGAAGVIGLVGLAIACFLAVLALPSIIGGWALYVEKSWAKPLLLVLSALHLPNFPIGTALGVYTIWALIASETPPAMPTQDLRPMV